MLTDFRRYTAGVSDYIFSPFDPASGVGKAELSETVDNVHEMSKNVVRSTLVAIIENFSSIKNWVLRTAKQEDETKSCHPADEETGAE